ncbi:MAG TPA: hypothetical protein VIO58_11305 [Candidatus Methanoperedens sp.]
MDAEKLVAVIGIIAILSALNAYMAGTSRVMQNISYRFKIPHLKELGAKGTLVAGIGALTTFAILVV